MQRGARPLPFTLVTITYEVAVYALAERTDTLLLFHLYPLSVVLPTEYTELQPLLSGVHSVMRVKLVLAGEGGGCTRPPPLITFTLTSKVAVYAPAEWADTLPLFHLYPLYVLCGLTPLSYK